MCGGCQVVCVTSEIRIKPGRACQQACSLDEGAIKRCLQAQHGTAGFSCEPARFDAKPAAVTSSPYMLCGATPESTHGQSWCFSEARSQCSARQLNRQGMLQLLFLSRALSTSQGRVPRANLGDAPRVLTGGLNTFRK